MNLLKKGFLSGSAMDQVVRIHDWRVPSAHVACDKYPYWISLSKLFIGDGFPGIYSAAQLSTGAIVSWFWTWTDFFYKNNKFLFIFLLLVAWWKDRRASQKLSFWQTLWNRYCPTYICPLCILCFCRRRVPGRVNHSSFSSCSMGSALPLCKVSQLSLYFLFFLNEPTYKYFNSDKNYYISPFSEGKLYTFTESS